MLLQGCGVLLVTSRRWHSCARLAMAFRDAGWRVDVICPVKHSVLSTSAVSGVWVYRPFRAMASVAEAIAGSSPNLIVPCDDGATADLQELARTTADEGLRKLIESSIGSESSYAVTTSRAGLHALAEDLNVAVPRATQVDSMPSVEAACTTVGLPAFLKTDGSSGGTGVRLIETPEQARAAYRRLASAPSVLRAMKRAGVDKDWSMLPAAFERRRSRLSLQQAIAGREANSTIFCWQGEVRGSITVEVVVSSMRYGPSTVVRRIDNPQIEGATAAIAKSLKLSGMFGFDFVLQEGTGQAMLLEMNARPTQTSHLALGEGHDLAAAAFAAVTGKHVNARPAVTTSKLIALFPGEWLRDPASEYLELAYHDVPWPEPELVRICMRRPSVWKRMLTIQGWKRAGESLRGGGGKDVRERSVKLSPEGHPSQVD